MMVNNLTTVVLVFDLNVGKMSCLCDAEAIRVDPRLGN